MTELVFEAPVGQRFHRYFRSITLMSEPKGRSLWWARHERKWMERTGLKGSSSHAPCRTLKAFKRHLRRHGKDLVGCKVVLVNRYMGYDVTVQL